MAFPLYDFVLALLVMHVLSLATACDYPLCVVLSESMSPNMHRGDVIFVTNYTDSKLQIGDVVVYQTKQQDIPIVHRIIDLRNTSKMQFLTKGDNNTCNDRSLYPPGQAWLTPADLIGRVDLTIPKIGYLTLFLKEYIFQGRLR